MDHFDFIQTKIVSDRDNLKFWLSYCHFKNLKVVFTNGCFDIIHRGHIEYLAKAASLGNVLIIGLNTDNSVARLKGPDRPLQDEKARAIVLASLSFVSKVIMFDEDTPYALIQLIQPDILVKGSDYSPEKIVGYEVVKAKGGEIVTIDFVEGYSTTDIIKKMNK